MASCISNKLQALFILTRRGVFYIEFLNFYALMTSPVHRKYFFKLKMKNGEAQPIVLIKALCCLFQINSHY